MGNKGMARNGGFEGVGELLTNNVLFEVVFESFARWLIYVICPLYTKWVL